MLILALGGIAGSGGPRAVAAEGDELTLRDRIVAVVDDDPILASDIEQVLGLGLAERREGEDRAALERRVLDQLIEQRLRFHEVNRFGPERIPVEVIEEQIAQIRERFPSAEAFETHLRELGLTRPELRQLVTRQLAIWDYIQQRLGPRVFIGLDDIRRYYDEELVPTMEGRGAPPPPLAEVREEIRSLLKARQLNEEIERWTEALRRQADVQILLDDYPEGLPPVRERLEGSGEAGGSSPSPDPSSSSS